MYKKYFPKKHLGQNFLRDKEIITKIIQIINPKKNDVLVEIGPGLSALTEPICQLLDNLIVIEIDSDLLSFFKSKDFFSKLTFFLNDALTFDYVNLFNKKKN